MKISVVAPMFNEEGNLDRTVSLLTKELESGNYDDYEIILVNDGSTDNTWERAKEKAAQQEKLRVVGYEKNRGRGMALRTGFAQATGDIIVSVDFDLTYAAEYVGKMVKEIRENEDVDVVLASIYMPGGKVVGANWMRLMISKLGNRLYKYAYGGQIHTSTCVVRAYRREVLDSIWLQAEDKEIHLEIISKVLALGYRIKEIPATVNAQKKGRSKFKWRAYSLSHLVHLIQERPFMLFGMLGLFLLLLGLVAIALIIFERFDPTGDFAKSFIGRLVSPNFVLVSFLGGLQMLGLGFLGIQNNLLKKELFKLQRGLGKK